MSEQPPDKPPDDGEQQKKQHSDTSGVKCCVCWETYTREIRRPMSLCCGHTFCRQCIRQMGPNGRTIRCGVCRALTYANWKSYGKNIQLLELLERDGLLGEDQDPVPANENANDPQQQQPEQNEPFPRVPILQFQEEIAQLESQLQTVDIHSRFPFLDRLARIQYGLESTELAVAQANESMGSLTERLTQLRAAINQHMRQRQRQGSDSQFLDHDSSSNTGNGRNGTQQFPLQDDWDTDWESELLDVDLNRQFFFAPPRPPPPPFLTGRGRPDNSRAANSRRPFGRGSSRARGRGVPASYRQSTSAAAATQRQHSVWSESEGEEEIGNFIDLSDRLSAELRGASLNAVYESAYAAQAAADAAVRARDAAANDDEWGWGAQAPPQAATNNTANANGNGNTSSGSSNGNGNSSSRAMATPSSDGWGEGGGQDAFANGGFSSNRATATPNSDGWNNSNRNTDEWGWRADSGNGNTAAQAPPPATNTENGNGNTSSSNIRIENSRRVTAAMPTPSSDGWGGGQQGAFANGGFNSSAEQTLAGVPDHWRGDGTSAADEQQQYGGIGIQGSRPPPPPSSWLPTANITNSNQMPAPAAAGAFSNGGFSSSSARPPAQTSSHSGSFGSLPPPPPTGIVGSNSPAFFGNSWRRDRRELRRQQLIRMHVGEPRQQTLPPPLDIHWDSDDGWNNEEQEQAEEMPEHQQQAMAQQQHVVGDEQQQQQAPMTMEMPMAANDNSRGETSHWPDADCDAPDCDADCDAPDCDADCDAPDCDADCDVPTFDAHYEYRGDSEDEDFHAANSALNSPDLPMSFAIEKLSKMEQQGPGTSTSAPAAAVGNGIGSSNNEKTGGGGSGTGEVQENSMEENEEEKQNMAQEGEEMEEVEDAGQVEEGEEEHQMPMAEEEVPEEEEDEVFANDEVDEEQVEEFDQQFGEEQIEKTMKRANNSESQDANVEEEAEAGDHQEETGLGEEDNPCWVDDDNQQKLKQQPKGEEEEKEEKENNSDATATTQVQAVGSSSSRKFLLQGKLRIPNIQPQAQQVWSDDDQQQDENEEEDKKENHQQETQGPAEIQASESSTSSKRMFLLQGKLRIPNIQPQVRSDEDLKLDEEDEEKENNNENETQQGPSSGQADDSSSSNNRNRMKFLLTEKLCLPNFNMHY